MPGSEARHSNTIDNAPAKAPSSPPKPRGGPRKGSGIKATDGAATARHQLTLDAASVAVFRALGGGNVSLGAREAARLAAAAAVGVFLPTPPPAGSGDVRAHHPTGG